ncbi:NnrS protein involved in response to NO, partial [hydrothermal vent metagenome]
VFTANALQQKKAGRLDHNPLLEYISAASLVLFIYGALGDMDARLDANLAGSLAFFTAAVQMVRFLRWRTWRIIDAPLVLVMHLSYLWFIFALVLFGAAAFMEQIPDGLWLHAFTVGALSMMMLSLITRVALRHTGRPLVPARLMLLSFGLMFVAAILRVMTSAGILSSDWLAVTIMIWGLSFALYLILHGTYLIRPSLPKRKKTTGRGSDGRASELG